VKDDIKRRMHAEGIEALREHRLQLLADSKQLRDTAAVSTSKEVEILLKSLKERLESVRSGYLMIPSDIEPHKVVALLSRVQGQEKEIRAQLDMWENAKDRKKGIDETLRICEEVIAEKESKQTFSTRREHE
jgi:hypothetical protein